jgi:hypothetical protein
MFYCSSFFVAGVVLSVLRGVVGEEHQQWRCVVFLFKSAKINNYRSIDNSKVINKLLIPEKQCHGTFIYSVIKGA